MVRPTAQVFAVCTLLLTTLPVAAQDVDVDALWEQYDLEATEFEAKQGECDSGDQTTTRVNRLCREAADLGVALASTIDEILVHDDQLTDDDRELLIDGMLTNRQIAGALWVELGECENAQSVLQTLTEHPDLPDRQLVEQAAQTWLQNAEECIAAAAPVEVAEDPSKAGPIIVLSSGLAILAAGFAWDMSMLGTINDFKDANEECGEVCSAESDEGRALTRTQESIDNAKPMIAVLYGVGAATAIGGVIWLAVQGGGNEDEASDGVEVRVMPTFSRSGAGASVRIGF
jgi:hypothetical protein